VHLRASLPLPISLFWLLQIRGRGTSAKQKGLSIKGSENIPDIKVRFFFQLPCFNSLAYSFKLSSVYGSAVSGVWAYQPPWLPQNHFLYDPEMMYIEIVDPNEQGVGLVILTSLW